MHWHHGTPVNGCTNSEGGRERSTKTLDGQRLGEFVKKTLIT